MVHIVYHVNAFTWSPSTHGAQATLFKITLLGAMMPNMTAESKKPFKSKINYLFEQLNTCDDEGDGERKLDLPANTLLKDYTDDGGGEIDHDLRHAVYESLSLQGTDRYSFDASLGELFKS